MDFFEDQKISTSTETNSSHRAGKRHWTAGEDLVQSFVYIVCQTEKNNYVYFLVNARLIVILERIKYCDRESFHTNLILYREESYQLTFHLLFQLVL